MRKIANLTYVQVMQTFDCFMVCNGGSCSKAHQIVLQVDEDGLTLDMGFSSEPSDSRNWTVLVSIAVVLVAYCVAAQLLTLLAISCFFVLSGYLAFITGKWRLKQFVQKLNEMAVMARKANRALLQREMLSFGCVYLSTLCRNCLLNNVKLIDSEYSRLGLSTSQALSSCRFHVFLCCKQNVLYLSSLADRLVSDDFM